MGSMNIERTELNNFFDRRVYGPLPVEVRELFWGTVIFLLVNLACWKFQPWIDEGKGLGWDGREYYNYAKEISLGKPIWGYEPKVDRLGTPFLAAMIYPTNLKLGFLYVNLFANILIVWLLPFWFASWIRDPRLRILLSLVFQTLCFGFVRFLWFYPILTDYWSALFFLGGLTLVVYLKDSFVGILSLSLLSFVGILFREVMMVPALAFLFCGLDLKLPLMKNIKGMAVRSIPLMATVVSIFLVKRSVNLIGAFPPGNISGRSKAYQMSDEFLYNFLHFNFLHFSGAFFTAFGMVTFVILLNPQCVFRRLKKEPFVMLVSILYSALMVVGGFDFERYFILFSPIVLLAAGWAIEEGIPLLRQWWGIGLLVVFHLFSQRFFWPLPQEIPSGVWVPPFSFLTTWGGSTQYLTLLNSSGQSDIVRLRFLQYLVLFLAIYGLNKMGAPKIKKTSPRST